MEVNKESHESDPKLSDQDNRRMEVLADQLYGEGVETDKDHR